MAKVKCPNAKCQKELIVSDEVLGQRMRCKVCNTLFMTQAAISAAPAASPAKKASTASLSRSSVTNKASVSRSNVFNRETVAPTEQASVALPPAPPPEPDNLGTGVIVAAVLALVLPIAAASGFVMYKTMRAKGGGGIGESVVVSERSLHAGIEIGAKGVKLVVLDVAPDPEFGYDVAPREVPDAVNTTLVAGLDVNGRFDPEAQQETVRAVSKFYQHARDQHQVPEDHIYVVGSSSLFATLKKGDPAEAKEQEILRTIQTNKESLAEAVRKATGKSIDFLEAADQVKQSFNGIVPRPYRPESVIFEFSSGNTRAAYPEDSNRLVSAELAYGTITYHKHVSKVTAKTRLPLSQEAQRLAGQELIAPFQQHVDRKPGLISQRRVYLSGGIVWAMVNYVHPSDRKAMVELFANGADEVDTFSQLLQRNQQQVIEECLAKVSDAKDHQTAEADLKNINKQFTQEQMIAGAELLRAIAETGRFRGRKVYFARHGYFAWVLSYVGEKGATGR